MPAIPLPVRSGRHQRAARSSASAPSTRALLVSPRLALQRQAIAATFGIRAPVVHRAGHKPRIGDQIRYPSTGPKKGEVSSVTKVDDRGGMEVRDAKNKTRIDIKWTDANVWIMHAADAKDVDIRPDNDAWAELTPRTQAQVLDDTKTQALKKIIDFASPAIISQTSRTRLMKEVTFASFQKTRAGGWQTAWNETEEGSHSRATTLPGMR